MVWPFPRYLIPHFARANLTGAIPVNTFKKFILATSLIATLAAPLAGCSRTWDGVKDDWHNMTSGDGDERTANRPAENTETDGWNVEPQTEDGPPSVNQ
jgi:predicted small secreted protein